MTLRHKIALRIGTGLLLAPVFLVALPMLIGIALAVLLPVLLIDGGTALVGFVFTGQWEWPR